MQTRFAPDQLADPAMAASEKILRNCVHCGFCTATCPTYVLLGDELDSPRGRIMLIKDMLENERKPTENTVKHIDRCLSCLSCMTTCPSGVHYMHLVDHARHYIEKNYRRPFGDRIMRALLARIIPNPGLFRLALRAGKFAKPLAGVLPARLRAMLALVPGTLPARSATGRPATHPAKDARRMRIAILAGCAQTVLAPDITEASIRLLTRHGCEVVLPQNSGCCGALTHHLGQDSTAFARANIDAWTREIENGGLDAIVITASGCGTTVKDYGFLFRSDPAYADKARRISELTRDISEIMSEIGLQKPAIAPGLRVAYHPACSLQHGQQIRAQPKDLLRAAGFTVADIPDAHLCCGSAGTYNMTEPAIARELRDRKVAAIQSTRPDVIASGNIGCNTQIASGTNIPVFHTAQLLDWATGGPSPFTNPATER